MNAQQARPLIGETFPRTFDKGRFRTFAINLLNHIDESKAQVWKASAIKQAFTDHVRRCERLGTYTSPEKDKLDVLIVHLTSNIKLGRARTAIRNFVADHLKTHDNKDAALVAFVSPTEKQWRFSYVTMEYAAVKRRFSLDANTSNGGHWHSGNGRIYTNTTRVAGEKSLVNLRPKCPDWFDDVQPSFHPCIRSSTLSPRRRP